jgi:hypothetical protein
MAPQTRKISAVTEHSRKVFAAALERVTVGLVVAQELLEQMTVALVAWVGFLRLFQAERLPCRLSDRFLVVSFTLLVVVAEVSL